MRIALKAKSLPRRAATARTAGLFTTTLKTTKKR